MSKHRDKRSWNFFLQVSVWKDYRNFLYGNGWFVYEWNIVKYSRFPLNDPILLKKWTEATQKISWNATTRSRICEQHFKQEYFCGTKRKRLKPNAVPTENLTEISDPLHQLHTLINTCKWYNLYENYLLLSIITWILFSNLFFNL